MPRPTHAQGRRGTRVIPADWEATHRPVAEKTMNATAALSKPLTVQAWDPEDEQMAAVPVSPYAEVLCRVQRVSLDSADRVAVDDSVSVSGYLVTVPANVSPLEGDLARITDSGDPILDGHQLRVVQVTRGSLRFERDLFCTLTA